MKQETMDGSKKLPKPLRKMENIRDKYDPKDINTAIVSYPRSGSHWIRIILELLLKRPCYFEAFFYDKAKPWGRHSHDIDATHFPYTRNDSLKLGYVDRVVFLYRNPVDVITSLCLFELQFERTINHWFEPNEENMRRLCLGLKIYLHHWFYHANCKWIYYLQYEKMLENPIEEIKKLIIFLGYHAPDDDIKFVTQNVTKEFMKTATGDQSLMVDKHTEKEKFISNWKDYILHFFPDRWMFQ